MIFTFRDGPVLLTGPGHDRIRKSLDGAAEPQVGPDLDPHLLLVQGDSGRICEVGYYKTAERITDLQIIFIIFILP